MHSSAARGGPSEGGWAVFVAGQDIRCPGPGRAIASCGDKLGEVSRGTIVRIRAAPPEQQRHPPSFTRVCRKCKSLLEQSISLDSEVAA
jgi:hypothetical protein